MGLFDFFKHPGLKHIWNKTAKTSLHMWLNLTKLVIFVSAYLESFFKDIRLKASQSEIRLGNRLRTWDNCIDKRRTRIGSFIKAYVLSEVVPYSGDIHIASSMEVLCTYEWKRSPSEDDTLPPTIYVPGYGRRFHTPVLPHKIMQDSGTAWMDQHVARVFDFQFEPLFQALSFMNPEVRFNDVNVVIGRSNLTLLFYALQGKSQQTFGLELKMVDKTLFVHGRGGGRVRVCSESYGRNFEEQFTQATGASDADGYHRALRYKLGPLSMVVRLEVDAFVEHENTAIEAVTDEFFHGHWSIDKLTPDRGISHTHATSVTVGGCYVPHSQTTELKCGGGEATVTRALPQLWAGHHDTIVVGDRKSGSVGVVENSSKSQKRALAQKRAKAKEEENANGFATFYGAAIMNKKTDRIDWEMDNQAGLQKLTGFLQSLIQTVSDIEGGKAILQKGAKKGPLELYEGYEEMTGALPQEIVAVFWE